MHLAQLTTLEVDDLDRERTVFLMALSPLEVHGPHLPLGTDVMVAEEVLRRVLERLKESHGDFDFVIMPTCYMGSDTIPGSVVVDSRAINLNLKALGNFLANRGFKYLILLDNHGGPRHQIAEAKAVRYLYQKRGFFLVAPFLSFYRRMVEDDPALLSRIDSVPGACGDVDDCHGGLNETSLMLASNPDKVRETWRGLERTAIKKNRWPALALGALSRLVRLTGAEEMAEDIKYIGTMLCWTTERFPPTYIGEPCAATAGAGHRMLDAFSEEAVERFEACLGGEPPFFRPIGWSLRFLELSR